LVKRIIYKDQNGNAIQDMSASMLEFAARKNKKNDPDPSVPFKADVIIYDIFNDNATIKILTNKFRFIDYAQLAKVDGNWKIINVLWAFTK
jgi:putative lumazine-binding protein